MALTEQQILAQNRWWSDPTWREADPHLALLQAQPARLTADFVSELNLGEPGIHVLRGPRQVGKSTDLKLLVERTLGEGAAPRSVVYLALDLLEDQALGDFATSVQRAVELAGETGSRGLVLLDEVTAVRGWQTAVKALWDQGTLREHVVVCTGSSAIDLQRGAAERLPGRRGAGADHLALPQSFAAFAHALDARLPLSPDLTVAELCTADGAALLRETRVHGPALQAALGRYLRFGGLPAAVAEAIEGAREPSERVKRVLEDSLIRELQRRGASVTAARALLERVVRSLGSKISWSRMAREMD
ncbi:MAG: ATP-binding protein, partial [Solirubrobacteraceae bacterium]